ncbi:MAG: YraN family protein [Bacillota bacterium]
MNDKRKTIGSKGETIARDYLVKKAYKIIQMNYRNHFGEIDIIAKDKDTYIFVEVKTRKNLSFGRPIEAINYKKQSHLIKTAYAYLAAKNLSSSNFRFDAIEVLLHEDAKPSINHIENIIELK